MRLSSLLTPHASCLMPHFTDAAWIPTRAAAQMQSGGDGDENLRCDFHSFVTCTLVSLHALHVVKRFTHLGDWDVME